MGDKSIETFKSGVIEAEKAIADILNFRYYIYT